MYTSTVLAKEKIISLSELQKNPSKALDSGIVWIVKHGKKMGIFLSKDEFEDLLEEHLPLDKKFQKELKIAVNQSKKEKLIPLKNIL